MSGTQEKRERTNLPAVQTAEADATIDLVEMFYRLLGSWKLILCLALVCAIAAGVYTMYFVTPMYRATSVIYVLNRSDSAINMSDLQIGSALTSDYVKLFSMWEIHEQVIERLNLPYSYGTARSMLSVTNSSNTRMLDLTVTSPSAKEAADMANAYAEVAADYIADRMVTDRPTVISTALVPANPVSPSKTRNIMMGFLLGGVAAAGFVVLRMLMDDKYKTAEDIRKYTGLITLAVIPVEEQDDAQRGKTGAKKKQGKRGGRRA